MSLGTVQINRLNLVQGALPEIERHFLFVGEGTENVGSVVAVGVETDLDEVLGEADSVLKTQVEAARLNAGQNFSASVMEVDVDASLETAIDYMDAAMEITSCEGIVMVEPVSSAADLESMHAEAASILSKYMRPVFFIASVRGIDAVTETWAAYIAAITPITTDVAADRVCVVPYLWDHAVGAFAGRLCNRAVTVADTPMRVATGPMLGEWSDRPSDMDGNGLTMAHLAQLDAARFSVPQWYPDYPGTYWGDGNMLDIPGGDYQVVENLRVVQKAMRRVYPLAVARIGDRRLNSTPPSLAENKAYFMRPLRAMAKSVTILGLTFPGEIHPPTDDAIEIVWLDKTTVEIYLMVRPYNCPKDITVNLALDLSTE